MECERATVLLSGVIDSALGPIARFRMYRHVAGCNACASKLEELRALQSAIRTKFPITAPRPDWRRASVRRCRARIRRALCAHGSACQHSAWPGRGWRVQWPPWR
jgi:anti-sigma factor RsiW